MGYESIISPNIPIYTDGMAAPHGPEGTKGFISRDWYNQPRGSVPYTAQFDLPLIPRSEWDDRIREKELNKTNLTDVCDQAGVKIKDQSNLPYCWIFAPTHCIEIARAQQNNPYVSLSPASAGAKVKNFRAVGGWGSEGLVYIVEHGLVPSSMWPDISLNRQYDNATNDAERAKYRCLEWYEMASRDMDAAATCVLNNIAVAGGFNHSSHEVTLMNLVKVNGVYGFMYDNSWTASWGDRGRGIYLGSKAVPDDAVAPRSVIPS